MRDTEKLVTELQNLAEERDAVILAHNYQRAEVQDAADIVGDSLALSMAARDTNAKVIVFCGVHFMAESAAILSPEKTVILPRLDAGCPMADMITGEDLRTIRKNHPGMPIVTYVNSSAEAKAESDVCCTSANAINVTENVGAPNVYMTPDRNLALWVARHTGQRVLYWNGYCPTHENLTAEDVGQAKADHPGGVFIAHPECRPEVLDLADAVLSTSGMIDYSAKTEAQTILVGTEMGLLHRLQKENPDKTFVLPSKKLICPNMKLTSLEDVVESLRTMENVVTVEEPVREKAAKALRQMLYYGRD